MPRLDRFKRAQEQPTTGLDAALRELRSGQKRGHWIWYVFPQLSGLGSSGASQHYGIDGIEEAVEYLHDPVLSDRLLAVATTVAERVRAGSSLEHLMGSSIDAMKVVSSLTLFREVAARLPVDEGHTVHRTLVDVADAVLSAADLEGYPRCARTLARL